MRCPIAIMALMAFMFGVGVAWSIPWWRAPAMKGEVFSGSGSGTHYINLDETGAYIICGAGYNAKDAFTLFKTYDLNQVAADQSVIPLWSVNGTDDAWTNGLRGGAVSYALGRVLSGTAGGNYKNWNVSFPIEPPFIRDSTVFAIYNDSDVIFDSGDFDNEGAYFYSNSYAAPYNALWKWEISNGLATNGTNLLAQASFASPNVARIRSVNLYRINGQDLLFYGDGSTKSGQIYSYNFDNETETLVAVCDLSTDIMNVKVSGFGTGQLYLNVAANDGAVQVFTLAPDGSSADECVASFSRNDILAITGSLAGNVRGFEVSRDGKFAYIDDHGTVLRVLWSFDKGSILLLR